MRWTTALFGTLLLLALPTVQASGTVTKIHVQEDGDAAWTVEIRQDLETQSAETAFRSLSGRIGSANATTSFRDRLRTTVEKAGERTGREMSIRAFSADAEVQGLSTKQGVVRYTFEWTRFAPRPGDTLTIGDAIEGYYIADGDLLEVRLPGNVTVASAEPAPDRESGRYLSWTGPQSFGPGEPVIEAALGTGDDTRAGADADGDGDLARDDESYPGHDTGGLNLAAIALVATLVLVAAGLLFRRYDAAPTTLLEPRAAGGTEPEAPVPDGERVVNLLRQSGGRMRQAEVAKHTGWSDAKVSNVTNRLKRDGAIEKRRWGRENILLLPDPDDA